MNLSQQVVSLDLAKRMKELGAPQESLFYWYFHSGNGDGLKTWFYIPRSMWSIVQGRDGNFDNSYISAYAAAELGEMLPEGYWTVKRDNKWWGFEGETENEGQEDSLSCADIESNARAKMWIYLKENNLL